MNKGLKLPSACRKPIGAIEKGSGLSYRSEWPRVRDGLPNQLQEFCFCGKSAQKHLSGLIYLVPETVVHVEARCLVSLENGPDRSSIDFVHSSRLVDYSSPRNEF